MTDKNRKWKPKEIAIFEEFHKKVIQRLARGELDVYGDKPEGYSEWAELNYEKTGGIRFPELDDKPKTICWSCKKEYPESFHKCPSCGSYNPKANINR